MDKPTKIFEICEFSLNNFNKKDLISGKENGIWKKYSATEYNNLSNLISYGLINLGINKGDKLSIISSNRVEWSIVDMGISKIGGVNAPIYPNITSKDYEYIIRDAGSKVVFAGSLEIYNKINHLVEKIDTLEHIFSFDQIDNCRNWREILDIGEKNPKYDQMKKNQEQIKSSDLFTLIYTSGTTGNPKGVMLSHDNLFGQFYGLGEYLPLYSSDRAISFLPLCHVFERVVEYYYILNGVSIYYAESIDKLGDNLKEISPSIMCTVPRLLEKLYDKIIAKGEDLTGFKKKLFFWAVNLGLQHELYGKNGFWYEFKLKIANKLIFKKWREALGGNLRYVFSGAAALQTRLAKVFTAANIPVYEGYGLSETSPVISANTIKGRGKCYGSVGKIMPGIKVKFSDEGEILCKGHNVMMGYFNKPELTSQVLDKDGWFSTGDVGMMIEDNFLKITDRKKEIFKTSGGLYIEPQVMENVFKESKFIEQIMVIGEGEKMPGAFIVPDFNFLNTWCEANNIDLSKVNDLNSNNLIMNAFQNDIDDLNSRFASYKRIKKFKLMNSSWSVETGELTATMKLRRKIIISKYSEDYSYIYKKK